MRREYGGVSVDAWQIGPVGPGRRKGFPVQRRETVRTRADGGPLDKARPSRATGVAPLAWLVVVALFILVWTALCAPPAGAATPALTLTAARDTITAGQTTRLTAQVDVPGAVLTVTRGAGGAPVYSLVRTVVTDAAGVATWPIAPRRTSVYRVEFAGDTLWDAAAAEITISVRPRLTLTVSSPVYQGMKVAFATRVQPAHPGAPVELQRRVAGVWTTVRTMRLDDSSRATHRWTATVRGSLVFRVAMAADADHIAGASGRRFVKVKDPNPYGVPTSAAHYVVVDKSKYRLFYHERGRIVRVLDCVLGKSSTPTPLGRFRIYAKDANVGGPYGPRRMRYLGAYAIHGTNEPWLLSRFPRGYSHGCTRLSNTNIVWLYDRCPVGTPVWNVP